MASYIEKVDLETGQIYYCKLYTGEHEQLKYIGDNWFTDIDLRKFTLEGDVRYALYKVEG